ncbi:MAG: cytochrome P450 [Chloroflexota bacterium]|nr:cytochrome P450 [Chloroflexota bacterium]
MLPKPRGNSMMYQLPPGPKPKPVVGNILEFRKGQLAFVAGLQREYGKASTFYMGKTPMVMFATPEAVRYVLVENAKNFTMREVTQGLRLLLGDGLLTTDGEFHRRQRRLMLPAFHRKRVEGYRDVMIEYTERMLEDWRAGQEVDMAREMQRLTLRIVAKALFNVDLTQESQMLGAAFDDTREYPNRRRFSLRTLRIDLPFTAYGKFVRAKALLDKTVYGIIAQRRATGEDTGDVISMLLEARDEDGSALTDVQVRDETMTLMAAGHETTANTLTWTFYLLSQHPAQRDTLLAELQRVLGGRAPTVADLANLPYLEMVVKEAMRLYPPAWMLGRHALQAYELEGYHMPADSFVMLSPWVIHRIAEYFPEPERFWPERFDSQTGEKHPPFAYFPFGAGPRMCIGSTFAMMEARLLLATLIQRYSPTLVPGHPVVPRPMVTLRTKFGMRMLLESTKETVLAV